MLPQSNINILAKIESAIEQNQLILPSPPDIIVKVRKVLDDPDSTHEQLAMALSTDASLVARVLKVANSAVYRRHQNADNLQQAVSRLGHKLINTLVTNHALMQLFGQPSQQFRPLLHTIQTHSTAVARLSYAIAQQYTRLSPEDALLAGLVHDIGFIPIVQNLSVFDNGTSSSEELITQLETHHAWLGARLLEHWHFPHAIVVATEQHETINRVSTHGPDLTDVVIVANLLEHQREKGQTDIETIKNVPAFSLLGIKPETAFLTLASHLENADKLLGG